MSEEKNTASFVKELREFWEFLPQKRVFGVLAFAWLALFQFWGSSTFGYIDTASLFLWMYNAYTAPFSVAGFHLFKSDFPLIQSIDAANDGA